MIKVKFLHFCESAILENGTGNLSLINIFENINSTNFPSAHPVVAIAVGFESDKEGTIDAELQIVDEEGELFKGQATIKIGPSLKGNWVNKIPMYQIPRDFIHKIMINHAGETIYTDYLNINNKPINF